MQWWIEEGLKDEQYKKHHNCRKKDNCQEHLEYEYI